MVGEPQSSRDLREVGEHDEPETADELATPAGADAPLVLVLGTAAAPPAELRRTAGSVVDAARRANAEIVDATSGALHEELARVAARDGASVEHAPGVVSAFPTLTALPERGATPGSGEHRDPVEQVAARADHGTVVVVVAGGDAATATTVLAATERGWPVIPVSGTGGLATQLAGRPRRAQVGRRRRAVDDDVERILEHGVLPLTSAGAPLTNRIGWELHDVPVLKLMWSRLAAYDRTARRLRRNAERLESSILLLGVLVTFLALFDNALSTNDITGWWDDVIHWSLVVIPALVSVLIAGAATVAAGKRWVLLRSATESIRREIFGWRTRTGAYAHADGEARHGPTTRLAERVAAIESRLMKTEVGTSALVAAVDAPTDRAGAHEDDDGVSLLGPEEYCTLRIDHQLAYYRAKVTTLGRRLRALQVASILAGGAGTILAITGNEIWIGLTTAIAAAVVAHLGHTQIDTTLSGYNQAIAALEEIKTRWHATPPAERTDAHFAELVAHVERALEAEQASWVRQMNLALDTPLPGA